MKISQKRWNEIEKTLGHGAKKISKEKQHWYNNYLEDKYAGKKEHEMYRSDVYFSCGKKARYRSQSEASFYARNAENKRGTKLRVYYCEICGGWHLTKRITKKSFES